jgi:hypothetical protein
MGGSAAAGTAGAPATGPIQQRLRAIERRLDEMQRTLEQLLRESRRRRAADNSASPPSENTMKEDINALLSTGS